MAAAQAPEHCAVEAIESLLDNHADPAQVDREGRTALDLAKTSGVPRCAPPPSLRRPLARVRACSLARYLGHTLPLLTRLLRFAFALPSLGALRLCVRPRSAEVLDMLGSIVQLLFLERHSDLDAAAQLAARRDSNSGTSGATRQSSATL